MISAHPLENKSIVVKFWKTRTRSFELNTVTAVEKRIFFVLPAEAPKPILGVEHLMPYGGYLILLGILRLKADICT